MCQLKKKKMRLALLVLFGVLAVALAIPDVEKLFNCSYIPPQENPKDVRKLRPSDIRVVMALGDSMTAGL